MNASAGPVLHETRTRLRLAVPRRSDPTRVETRLRAVDGVQEVRTNTALRCVIVSYDGEAGTRERVLACLDDESSEASVFPTQAAVQPRPIDSVPVMLALAGLAMPQPLRRLSSLAAIGTRVAAHPKRLRKNTRSVVFDATSLAALAVSGQEVAASTSLVLRWLAERWSSRLVRQADELLAQLLPTEATGYHVLREPALRGGKADDEQWWPLRSVRAGDRLRLFAGDVVPVDGRILDGEAWFAVPLSPNAEHRIGVGDRIEAGERLMKGTVELLAEASPAQSRLERLRHQVRQIMGARDPAGLVRSGHEPFTFLPLMAASLVWGFSGDAARAATMLQADPQRGMDLALPLVREAVLAVMARQGLLASGLESIERLALARTLVLQDTGVIASGRWIVESIEPASPDGEDEVRPWLARLAGVATDALATADFSDAQVRSWVRHGAHLWHDGADVHLAAEAQLRATWGLHPTLSAPVEVTAGEHLRRRFAAVRSGEVVAWVTLASPLRDDATKHIQALHRLGFKRIAVFREDDGSTTESPLPVQDQPRWKVTLGHDSRERQEWLAQEARNGRPMVMVHSVMRDLLPPGSVSLTPQDSDAGSHGLLFGDPLQTLVAARRLALLVHRRVLRQQQAAAAADASLITASALQWAPPIVTALANHGFTLLLLLDSMRLASLSSQAAPGASPSRDAAQMDDPQQE